MRRVRSRLDRRNNDLQNIVQGVVAQCIVPDVLSQCQLHIGITLIEADGGVEACAVNAAMLALADAGAHPAVEWLRWKVSFASWPEVGHVWVLSSPNRQQCETWIVRSSAGVPMRDLAVACSAGILAGQPSLDLNHMEESSGCVRVLIAWQPNLDLLASVQLYERMEATAFEELMTTAQTGCAKLYSELQEALTMRVKQLAIGAGVLDH
jgi:exosome complex component RRP41